jgi:hypothetical protein
MGDGGYARIRHGMAMEMIEIHGHLAYAHALEKVVECDGDEFRAKIWRDVLNDIDEYFKQGEEQ